MRGLSIEYCRSDARRGYGEMGFSFTVAVTGGKDKHRFPYLIGAFTMKKRGFYEENYDLIFNLLIINKLLFDN